MHISREPLLTLELPYRERLVVSRTLYSGGAGPRMAVVAGIHGDELEGLYLCHRLAAWLERLAQMHPQGLLGEVALYPAVNPLGLDTLHREVPVFGTDLNRSFPGHLDGLLPQRVADALMRDLEGAALVVDVHASNRFLRELPQLRIARDYTDALLPFGRLLNVELAWLQDAVIETTMKFQLNRSGIPCIVVEMGIGMRVRPLHTEQLMVGLLHLFREHGVLASNVPIPPRVYTPRIVQETDICYLNAETAGLFIPVAEHGASVMAGDVLGHIVSPHHGAPLAEVRAPAGGLLFTLRAFPLVYEGSLMGRIARAAGGGAA
jgi:predicted deacylase